MSLRELLAEISQRHFPNPPASPEEIARFEERVGWRLDPDLRGFYLHCNGADLFQKPDSPYRFLPLQSLVRARVAIRGKDDDTRGPATWYAVCALHDSNFILVDTEIQRAGLYAIRDGYREGFPDPEDCPVIASSFSEFLDGALRSEGRWFWLRQPQPEHEG